MSKNILKVIVLIIGLLTIVSYPNQVFAKKKVKLSHIKKWEKKKDVAKLIETLQEYQDSYLPKSLAIKVSAIKSLGRIRDPRALPILTEYVHHEKSRKNLTNGELPNQTAFWTILEYNDPDALLSALREPKRLDNSLIQKGLDKLSTMALSSSQWQVVVEIIGEKPPKAEKIPMKPNNSYIGRAALYLDFLKKIADHRTIEPFIVILSKIMYFNIPSIRHFLKDDTLGKIKQLKENTRKSLLEVLDKNEDAINELVKIALHGKEDEFRNKAMEFIVMIVKDPAGSIYSTLGKKLKESKANRTIHVHASYKPGVLIKIKNDKQSVQHKRLKTIEQKFEKLLTEKGYKISAKETADVIFHFSYMEKSEVTVYRRRVSRPGEPYPSGYVSYNRFSLQLKNEKPWERKWQGPYSKLAAINMTALSKEILEAVDACLVISKLLK
jgi:hypothetical protein